MSGQPLFVNDLPAGTVTVKVVRGTTDAVVPTHRVELQGPGKMLVATTDAQGRAQFGPLPAGTLTQAFTTLDGQQLMSAAFPIPSEGGTRLLLASPTTPTGTPLSPLPLLSTATEVPYGASPLAQMAGLPLQVGDLPPGTISVRLLRGGFENPIVGHEVELHGAGASQALRVSTDAEGRALFPPLEVGLVVYARSVVDGEVLESQAFPLPDRGGVRMVLVAGTVQAPIAPSGPPVLEALSGNAVATSPVATNAGMPVVSSAAGSEGVSSIPGLRVGLAVACFGAACAVIVLGRRHRRPRATNAAESPGQ